MVHMNRQCSICGRMCSQSSEKRVRFRGMDRRGETRVVDSDVSDVFTGECCASEILDNPEEYRYDGSHQKYLNQVLDGSVGFVLLIEIEREPVTVEAVQNSGSNWMPAGEVEIEDDTTAYAPVLDVDLPDEVRDWMIGKFGETGGVE